MIPHALLASLPLILIAATIVTVHSLSRAVLLIAWAAAEGGWVSGGQVIKVRRVRTCA